MDYATILGLDLGKFKSVCCLMDATGSEHRFGTIDTTPATIQELLTRHAARGTGVLLVVEAWTRPGGFTSPLGPSRSAGRITPTAAGGAR